MFAVAVVLDAPEQLALRRLALTPLGAGQVVVEVEWTSISTGTERLLWSGTMPPFPGMGYPLVPGYETVGRVVEIDASVTELTVGDRVFVPGANCFGEVRGLFGGAASRLVVPAARVVRIGRSDSQGTRADGLAEEGVLLSLAATAQHALSSGDGRPCELIVGHGVLGRLLARLAVAQGGSPVVWETNPARATGAVGYRVLNPAEDTRKDYRSIYDVSGDAALVDTLIGRLGRGGEIVLAGFYEKIQFGFPLAFMKEARIRVASEFTPADLRAVLALCQAGTLKLDELITHATTYEHVTEAYATAFTDPTCLKMLIDWRKCE